LTGTDVRVLAPGRPPLHTAKLFEACDSFEHAAQVVSELLRQYVGVRRWYALRRRGSRWTAVDTQDLARLEARDTLLFASAMLGALADATGPLLIAQLRDFAPASQKVADSDGSMFLVGAPLVQRRRVDGFVCGLTPTVPYAHIKQHNALIQSSARLLSTLMELEDQARTFQRWAERAQALTLHDSLTMLLNRRGWDEALQKEELRAQRYGHSAILFVLDLDGFKVVNDREGHEVGDKVLQSAAAALKHATRANDVVARLGGDEFGVLAVESDEATGAMLYRRLSEMLELAGIHASIGMAKMGTLSAAQAWNEADRAMYVAKRRRSGG
jgi:diguanylate cyclase (GGDEF)-like protein